MKKVVSILVCGLLWTLNVQAQSPKAPIGKANFEQIPDPISYAEHITVQGFKEKMTVLCSDSLAGRETGEIGQVKASYYIASQFEKMGLAKKGDDKSYFQHFTLKRSSWGKTELEVRGKEYEFKKDWYALPNSMESSDRKIKRIYYIPKGTKYNKLEGKTVIVNAENDPSIQINVLKTAGVSAIFLIQENLQNAANKNRRAIGGYDWQAVVGQQELSIPVVYLSSNAAQSIFGKYAMKVKSAKKCLRIKTKIDLELKKDENILKGSNVLGFMEGSDPVLKNEIIAITGHYDHLGEAGGVIYYGADDNASGTTGVLEIAEAFVQARKAGITPKRSMLFMLVSGEEKGLLGSKYYTDYPIFPLENTIVDLNTDMIGRVDEEHIGKEDYIYVIGSDRLSSELHEINESMNAKYTKINLDYRFNAPGDPNHFYERSDHYNFAKNNIPVIFYFNGVHADYHKATDTIEKINFETAAKRAQLTFYTAWELAHRANRPRLN